ncbi:MAG: S-layer homology domain-containing protein [Acidobacteria bacterium]|nr:S-layer homology domain-containing protein [Acidobacteriota bacterium]
MVLSLLWFLLFPGYAQLRTQRTPVGETQKAPQVDGEWSQTNGRWVWRAQLTSAEAGAMRLHFRDFHAAGGTVKLSGATGLNPAVYQGGGLHRDGEFWSDILPGDTAYLEFQPAGNEPGPIPFTVDEVAHFYGKEKLKSRERAELTTPCYADVYGTSWAQASPAVALMVFQDTALQMWYTCTGALVADKNNTRRPLFLTAHHCIQREEDARTVITFWNFQTTSTNSYPADAQNVGGIWNIPSLATSLPSINGAHLLYTLSESEGDASLLELPSLPANPVFLKLNRQEAGLNTPTGTIHHPEGSWKRLSLGSIAPVEPGIQGDLQVNGIFRPSDYYYTILEPVTPTNEGSSGSPAMTSDFLLSGILSAGPTPTCNPANRYAVYGRITTLLPRILNIIDNTAPGACSYSINGSNANVPTSETDGFFQIVTTSECPWAVASDNSFLSVYPKTGTGSGSINYQLKANVSPFTITISRVGSISIIGDQRRVIHFLQSGADNTMLYNDLNPLDTFSEYINYLKRRTVGAAYGCTDANFCPSLNTTRGMMAQFIIQSLFLNNNFAIQSETPYFTDVPRTHPAFRYVQKMKELTITSGCSATLYCPDAPVTRGEMSVFIIRALQFRNNLPVRSEFPYSTKSLFTDVSTTDSFFPFIQKMKELGITSGCSETKYCPLDATSRGQIAVFLVRAIHGLWEGRPQ